MVVVMDVIQKAGEHPPRGLQDALSRRHCKRALRLTLRRRGQAPSWRLSMYRGHGLDVGVPAGRSEFSDSLMSAPFDGVPYSVDEYSHFVRSGTDREIRRSILHRQLMIERYHTPIKAVYDYCTGLGKGDIWVLAGGGAQLQAFFGCSEGYLAILYLGLEDEAAPCKTCALQPQFENNEALFASFTHPGIELSYFPR